MFIEKECGNTDVVTDGRELARNITRKRIATVLKAYSVVNALCESIQILS